MVHLKKFTIGDDWTPKKLGKTVVLYLFAHFSNINTFDSQLSCNTIKDIDSLQRCSKDMMMH